MQQSELELIKKDFGESISYIREMRRKSEVMVDRQSVIKHMFNCSGHGNFRTDKDTGIVWWGKINGFFPGTPAGKPADYLKIRDDYKTLENFVALTLDRGHVHESTGTHAETFHDFSYSEYVAWLHNYSNYEHFKSNLESAVVTLLDKELDRDFQDMDENLERARSLCIDKIDREFNSNLLEAAGLIGRTEEDFLPNLDFVLGSIGLGGLSYEQKSLTPSQIELKHWFINKIAPALGPESLEDWGLRKYGKSWHDSHPTIQRTYDYKAIAKHNVVDARKLEHEVLAEYKKRWLDHHLKRGPKYFLKNQPSFAYDRLAGLLEVVSCIGKPGDTFLNISKKLGEKAQSKEFIEINLDRGIRSQNIYSTMLLALGAIQQYDLRKLWRDIMRNPNDKFRGTIAVYGMLRATKEPRLIQEKLPEISLKIRRLYETHTPEQMYTAISDHLND